MTIDSLPPRPLSVSETEQLADQYSKFCPIAWDDDNRPYAVLFGVSRDEHVLLACDTDASEWVVVSRLESADPFLVRSRLVDWLNEYEPAQELSLIDAEIIALDYLNETGGSQ